MANETKYLENVEKIGIVFSSNTMSMVKIGELTSMKQYLAVMIGQLTNPVEVKNAVDAQMSALGVTEEEALAVVKTMQSEFYCIEVPNNLKLVEELKGVTGLRQYLINNNMLIVAEDEEDALSKIKKLKQ